MGSLIQGGVDLPIVAAYTASGLGATGLTVTVDVHRLRAGSWSEVVTAGSATEVGDGLYAYVIGSANVAAGDLFAYVFKTAGTADQKHLFGLSHVEANYTTTIAGRVDAAISTRATDAATATAVWAAGSRTLTSFGTLVADVWAYATRTLTATGLDAIAATATGAVNMARAVWDRMLSSHPTEGSAGAALSTAAESNPESTAAAVVARLQQDVIVVPDGPVQGDLVLVQGDDYLDADDRALKFDFYNVPDLTGATADLGFALPDGNVVAATGTLAELTDPDGNTFWRAELDLEAAATADLTPLRRGGYPYQVTVVRDGSRLTYRTGLMRLIASATLLPPEPEPEP